MTATAARGVSSDLAVHLRRAQDHVDRHFAEDLDLDRLARVAGVSKYHFVRSFEAAYGETPIRYLTRRRIERAQDLLRSANLTVTEVCTAVGYASFGSFSTRFRALTGPVSRRSPTGTAGPPAARRTCRGASCSCGAWWTSGGRPARAEQSPRSPGAGRRP